MKIRRAQRKGLSAGISLLMIAMSVAVPLMERADISHQTAVESEHDPLSCPPAHDHTICSQATANLAIASFRDVGPMAPLAMDEAHGATTTDAVGALFPEGHPSRAPPLA